MRQACNRRIDECEAICHSAFAVPKQRAADDLPSVRMLRTGTRESRKDETMNPVLRTILLAVSAALFVIGGLVFLGVFDVDDPRVLVDGLAFFGFGAGAYVLAQLP